MKKYVLSIILLINVFLSGYTFPDNIPYVIVNCNLGSNITIYFPEGSVNYLKVDETSIISGSGTIYGYTDNYRITFPVFDAPYYRVTGSYTDTNLNITQVKENHLFDYSYRSALDHNLNLFIYCGLGVVILCLLFIRLH